MSPEVRPRRTLPDAISLARLRGKVQVTGNRREALYHFTIVTAGLVAFVRARFAERILATSAQVAAEFRDDIARLRAVAEAAGISRELWLRSRHGTWRFFRIIANGLVEISRDGQALPDDGAGPAAWWDAYPPVRIFAGIFVGTCEIPPFGRDLFRIFLQQPLNLIFLSRIFPGYFFPGEWASSFRSGFLLEYISRSR
jgi:hypothetical protein